MNTPQPGRACPVDLDYPDPQPPNLDMAAIIGRGRRIRHRRRLTQLGAVLAAFVVAGSVIAGARGFTIRTFPSQSGPAAAPSAAPIDAQLIPDVALASSVPGTAWPVLGLTSPQAVRVVLTAFGKDVTANVVPVPITAGKTVGVFLAWIRAPGHSFSSTDVTNEVAYDQSGHIIAHASNPP